MQVPSQFVQIDEEGYALSNEIRIQDPEVGLEILSKLFVNDRGIFQSQFGNKDVLVEAFSQPLVASQVHVEDGIWTLLMPYGFQAQFQLDSLSVDEWDRFHGYTESKVPFVMSRKAQALFFEQLTEFDDESITFEGVKHEVPSYWSTIPRLSTSNHWTNIYKDTGNPGWNLGEPAEALKDMLPRIKLSRAKVLVPGCGEGHDAAHFAQKGHIVYAVDFSEEAIARAKKNYGHLPDLHFIQADIFKLPQEWTHSFDLVFEHTLYCAVDPVLRNKVLEVYSKVLHETGQLMGVFFAFERRFATPFGGTEWELRERLKKNYNFIFWGRVKNSIPRRLGKELFVYASKKPK